MCCIFTCERTKFGPSAGNRERTLTGLYVGDDGDLREVPKLDSKPGGATFLRAVQNVLAAHGSESRDYILVTVAPRAKQVKVLYRSPKLTSAEAIIALTNLIMDFPDERTILLLEADQHWRQKEPKSGLKLGLGQIDPIPKLRFPRIPRAAAVKTRELRGALSKLLADFGDEDWLGKTGDYWIYDDWVGPYSQKVFVWRNKLVTTSLIRQIQQMLKSKFSQCIVILVMDDTAPNLPREIRIAADSVQEEWSR